MELLILSHAPRRVLEQGWIPAAHDLQLKVTLLTDCPREHLLKAKASSQVGQCKLFECDVFNPLSVARFLSLQGQEFAGVLAADAALGASAAVTASYLGLPGASCRSAVLCDQTLELRKRFEPGIAKRRRWVVNCFEPDIDIGPEWFPVTTQPLEGSGARGEVIVHNLEGLKRELAALRYGYALVEQHDEHEQRYAVDLLCTVDGLLVLRGSHIAFNNDEVRTKRIQSFTAQPPHCQELLALLTNIELGLGRHHVEYAVAEDGLRIKDIHNGLQDDESEWALHAEFNGDLFKETIKATLGMPVKLLRHHRADPMFTASVLEAAA